MADLDKDRQALQRDIERLSSDVAKLTETVGSLLGQQAGDLKAAIAERALQLVAQGRSRGDQALSGATAYERQAEEATIRNPLTAMAVAAGVGFLFGIMSRGR